jgi:hypothetical protein
VDRVALQVGMNEITVGSRCRRQLGEHLTHRQRQGYAGAQRQDFRAVGARRLLDGGAPGQPRASSDDFGVTRIAWASDRGTSGVARGTSP